MLAMRTMQILLLSLAATALTAAADSGAFAMHGRVSFDAGGAMIKGASDGDWGMAPVNTLVLPGDTLWVEKGGTLEIELSGGAFVRMADGSKAEVSALPPNATFRGWAGSFYVHRLARSSGAFAFVTPACTVDIPSDSMVRVDVVESGGTTVSVRWGGAVVRPGAGEEVRLGAGERSWIDPGLLPSLPAVFDRSAEDSFDAWNRERGTLLAAGPRSTPKSVVVSEPVLGFADLDYNGEWVYIENQPYWRPTIVTNYVPYRYGYWSYVPAVGSVWVGNYPFCYTTSHYGRWTCNPRYGWVWSYDPVWSPAWVASVRCGDYFFWSPVGYNCTPAYYTESAYFSIGGVNFGMYATSYAPYSQIYCGPAPICPMQPTMVDYIGAHHHDTYVWNIGTHRDPQVRVPYTQDALHVRDYAPQRSIRGPAAMQQGGQAAYDRVRSLESQLTRSGFAPVSRNSGGSVRTASAPANREAGLRSLRYEKPSVTAMPTHFVRPEPGPDLHARTSGGSAGAPAGRSTRSSGSGTTVRGADAVFPGATQVRHASPSGEMPARTVRIDTGSRGMPSVTPASDSNASPGRTTPPPSSRSYIRTTPSSPSNTPGRTESSPSRSYIRTTPSAPSSPSRTAPSTPNGSSRTPSQTESSPSRSYIRTTPSAPSSPSRTTPSTPSSPSRTPGRTESSPSRSYIRTTPSTPSSPSRTTPSSPSSPSRTTPRAKPSRYVPPSRDIASTPSSGSTPSITRSAPTASLTPPSSVRSMPTPSSRSNSGRSLSGLGSSRSATPSHSSSGRSLSGLGSSRSATPSHSSPSRSLSGLSSSRSTMMPSTSGRSMSRGRR